MSYEFGLQLMDADGVSIGASGGLVYVAAAGGTAKATLHSDKAGTAKTNPFALVRGGISFFATVDTVDLYILAPGGQFAIMKNVKASGSNEVRVDTSRRNHCMVIPFNIADTAANTETKTGFVLPAKSLTLPSPFVDVATIDAGMSIDVGTDSAASGDADGFIDGVSVATAGLTKATLANSGVTLGALLKVQDSTNAGDAVPEANVSQAGKEVSYTLSASSDTAAGFIHLPYLLAA